MEISSSSVKNVFKLITSKGGERKYWIDYLKVFAIILMVFGHAPVETGTVRMIIYAFHMPLFFTISGFLYKERTINEEIKKISRSLYIPVILWLIILYPYAIYKHGDTFSFITCVKLASGALENTSAVYSHLWFVFAMITIRSIAAVCQRLKINFLLFSIFSPLFLFVISSCGYLATDYMQIKSALLCFPFFTLGNFLKHSGLLNMFARIRLQWRLTIMLSLSACLWFTINLNGDVTCFDEIVGNNILLFYFNAITCCMIVIYIYSSFKKGNFILATLSDGTLLILALHKFIIGQISALHITNVSLVILFSIFTVLLFFFPIRITARYIPILLGKCKHIK